MTYSLEDRDRAFRDRAFLAIAAIGAAYWYLELKDEYGAPIPLDMPRPKRTKIASKPLAIGSPNNVFGKNARAGAKALVTSFEDQENAIAVQHFTEEAQKPVESDTKRRKHISGRILPSSPPNTRAMQGFEEHMQSSSPQIQPPQSVARAQATPSFLGMSGFKKRARQPSLLQMVQRGAAADNEEDDDMEDSVLRELEGSSPESLADSGSATRKRKANTLNLGGEEMMPSSPPAVNIETSEDEVGEEEEEVQIPVTQGQTFDIYEDADVQLAHESSSDTPQDLPSDPADLPLPADERIPSSLSPAIANPPSDDLPQPKSRRTSQRQSQRLSQTAQPQNAPSNTRTSTRQPVRRRNGRIIKPKHFPPSQRREPSPAISGLSPVASSSPSSQVVPPAAPIATVPAQGGRRQIKTTHLRADGQPVSPKPTHGANVVTSEALRRLLPRRLATARHAAAGVHADPFDLSTSSPTAAESTTTLDEEDDDSDSVVVTKGRGAKAKRKPLGVKSTNVRVITARTTGAAAKAVKAMGKSNVSKPTSKPAAKARATPATGRRNTYSRRTDAGEEEREDNDDSIEETTMEEAVKSRELQEAVKTFREVDEWELSFESCDVGGGGSSPWR